MSGGFFHYILFGAAVLPAISGVIQLVYRNKTPLNYILSATFSCIGFTILYLALPVREHRKPSVPHLS
ncbi:MAG TPA: hypothetical protein PKK43_07225 [Spirochaetota bacterium]|nr:hypothetical protein [Spirochaetota bacterium]